MVSQRVSVPFFVYDRSGVQRIANNESGVMQAEHTRSSSPPQAAESVDSGTTRTKPGPDARLLASKGQGRRKSVPGLSCSLLLPRAGDRQKDIGLIASDILMKTAKCSYFWMVRQDNASKGWGGGAD